MSAANLKVGDKVKLIKLLIHDSAYFYIGQIGIVTEVFNRDWGNPELAYNVDFDIMVDNKKTRCPQTCYREELARVNFNIENA